MAVRFRLRLAVHIFKDILEIAAMRALPMVGKLAEGRSWQGFCSGFRIPIFWVVNVIANNALVAVEFAHGEVLE